MAVCTPYTAAPSSAAAATTITAPPGVGGQRQTRSRNIPAATAAPTTAPLSHGGTPLKKGSPVATKAKTAMAIGMASGVPWGTKPGPGGGLPAAPSGAAGGAPG